MTTILARVSLTFATCLALATVMFGQDNCIHQRIITVTGTAEIHVPPDQVTVRLAVESHDKDLGAAKANNDRSIQKLLALAGKEVSRRKTSRPAP